MAENRESSVPFYPRTRADVVIPGVGHEYWSTYCRHNRHDLCKRGCKVCTSPCICTCHLDGQP